MKQMKWLCMVVAIVFFTQCNSVKNDEKAIGKLGVQAEVLDSATMRSKEIFSVYCSGCHGQQMEAFADRKWKHGKALDSIKASINNGYPGTEMPSWKPVFSEKEIDDLAKYIRTGIENVERYGFQEERLESDTFQLESVKVQLDTVFSGVRVPWYMNWLPNGDMLVTSRKGGLFRVDNEGNQFDIQGVPAVRYKNQSGLFEIQLHPDFSNNSYVYLTYAGLNIADGDTTTTTVVSRLSYADDKLSDEKIILEATPYTKKHIHFGARMVLDDKYLFVTIGDRGVRDVNPQDLTKIPGKIHRFYLDGSVPEDNPFVDEPGAIKSIWTYGHRNLQGLTINPNTGEMWEHEHGPRGGDEINIIKPGNNYGWPVISYGINYDATIFTSELEKEGMEQPLHYWVPSIAPCGMEWVTTDKYGDWKGSLLIGSLRFKYLNRCIIEDGKVVREENMLKGIGRLRNVAQGPDGYIYVAVEKPGYIFRLMPID